MEDRRLRATKWIRLYAMRLLDLKRGRIANVAVPLCITKRPATYKKSLAFDKDLDLLVSDRGLFVPSFQPVFRLILPVGR